MSRDQHPDVVRARQAVERIEAHIDHAPADRLDGLYAELDEAVAAFHAVHDELREQGL